MPDSSSRITAGELVLVCSRYDLGAIQSLRRLRGGSRESPKVLVASDRGRYLIKRRAPRPPSAVPGDDLAHRVALSHQVQLHHAAAGFPVAPIVGTRAGNNSLLELNGYIYEVFEFVDGSRYDRTPAAARSAGRLLAAAHRLLADLHPRWTPPGSTYHNHAAVAPSIDELITREADRRVRADLLALRESYQRAATEAERRAGWTSGPAAPVQLVHADWHPGNLLFASGDDQTPGGEPRVVAVLDFDSVRLGRPVLDLANGALQFAIARRSVPAQDSGIAGATGIRVSLNAELLRAFVAGYLGAGGRETVPGSEMPALPWLMIEAIVVETVAPIVATGKFGKVSAEAALAMTRRAAEWIAAESDQLLALAMR